MHEKDLIELKFDDGRILCPKIQAKIKIFKYQKKIIRKGTSFDMIWFDASTKYSAVIAGSNLEIHK